MPGPLARNIYQTTQKQNKNRKETDKGHGTHTRIERVCVWANMLARRVANYRLAGYTSPLGRALRCAASVDFRPSKQSDKWSARWVLNRVVISLTPHSTPRTSQNPPLAHRCSVVFVRPFERASMQVCVWGRVKTQQRSKRKKAKKNKNE